MSSIVNEKNMHWMPIFLILYNFGANLANDIYLPSMPHLVKYFSTTSNLMQLTMTAWFAGVALPQLFFGPLTDKYGRRPVLFAGGILFLITTLICTLATNVWMLITARFFQGVGVCSLNVATFGILSDLYDYKSRTKIMNKISMCGTLAPLVGPIVGGYVLTLINWQANFVIIFVLGLVSLIGLWFHLPESNTYLNPYALNIKNLFNNYLLLLKNKIFIRNLVPYCLSLGGLVAYLTASPFIIITKLKIAPDMFGYTQLPVFVVFILGSIYLTYVESEAQIRKLLVVGLGLVFISTVLMLTTSTLWGNHLILYILPMTIYALGFSLSAAALISEVISAVSFAKGSAAAFLGFGMALSCMLSSLLLGILYNGTIVSIASLLFLLATLGVGVYFQLTNENKMETVIEETSLEN